MAGMTFNVDLSIVNDEFAFVNVENMDDLHTRFARDAGSGGLTAAVEYQKILDPLDISAPWADLTIDGTIQTIDVSNARFVRLRVKTAQSGNNGRLFVYPRRVSTISGGVA